MADHPGPSATASAPASIGNVGVGFDILGLAFDAARDRVTAVLEAAAGVRLGAVSGLMTSLPGAPATNTALAAAQALLEAAGAEFGVRLSIDKGVPLSAGMGGSAASAVAAAAAVNALLPKPFATADLLHFALAGERVSCDPPPWDNVVAALFGGLVLVAGGRSGHAVSPPSEALRRWPRQRDSHPVRLLAIAEQLLRAAGSLLEALQDLA